ncbi:hypothetical protein R80B4_01100 [Fibrobacteres bacterium R8-0-B4]
MNVPMNLPIVSLDPSVPLKKHTATIHIETTLTVTEHKLMNILYKVAFETRNWEADWYRVSLSDIRDFLGRTVIDKSDIEKNLENLRKARISWNIFNQDQKNKKDWDTLSESSVNGAVGFISGWGYSAEDSCVVFSIDPLLKSIIKNPNIFTYIDLRVQRKLTSKYEVKLYELLADELNRSKKTNMTTRLYSIGDLHRIFGVSPDSYLSDAREFNRHCIKGPMKEINEHSDLAVEIQDIIKTKNKVTGYTFKIATKEETASADGAVQEALDLNVAVENPFIFSKTDYNVFDELAQLFNSVDVATKIFDNAKNKHTAFDFKDLIRENIEYAKRSKKSAKNFLGYLRTAIDNDYAGYEAKVQKRAQEQIKTEERQKKAKQQAEIDKKKEQEDDEANKQIRQEERKRLSEELKQYLTEKPDIWQTCLKTIESKLPESAFAMWFAFCDQLFMDNDHNAYVIANHQLAVDKITAEFLDTIAASFTENNVKVAAISVVTAARIKEQFLQK